MNASHTLFGLLAVLLQENAPAEGGTSTVRIVAGVLALVLLGIVIVRRKKSAKKDEDEF